MKKTVMSVLVGMMLVLLHAVPAQAQESAIRSVAAVLETQDLGQVVVGARIEYEAEVKAVDVNYIKTFTVEGYPIIGTYVNNDGKWDNAKPSGRYVFLKFAVAPVPGSVEGRSTVHDGKRMRRVPVHIPVKQQHILNLANGTVAPMCSTTNDQEINLLVDDFHEVTFVDSSGTSINYRLFIPAGYESRKDELAALPLVVFLHGSGQNGDNNITQLLASPSALEFSRPESQEKHPCFVMAPQAPGPTPNGGMWVDYTDETRSAILMSDAMKAVVEAIGDLGRKYNIDADRIYGTGLSAGAMGTMATAVHHPDLYAALLPIAGINTYSDAQVKNIINKPIWLIMAADEIYPQFVTDGNTFMDQLERLGSTPNRKIGDEGMNGFLRGTPAKKQAQAQLDEAKANGQTVLLTHLVEGTVMHSPHWSWVWAYNNEAIRDWLFSQSK